MIPLSFFIYVVEASNGTIKIGRSEHPERRLYSINTHSPLPVRMIAKWPGLLREEQDLHRRFAKSAVHREWFARDDHTIPFISEIYGKGMDQHDRSWELFTLSETDREARRAERYRRAEEKRALIRAAKKEAA